MVLSTVSRAFSGESGVVVTGTMRPWSLIDGGIPAVIKRSEADFSTIRDRRRSISIADSSHGHSKPLHVIFAVDFQLPSAKQGLKILWRLGFLACDVPTDDAALH